MKFPTHVYLRYFYQLIQENGRPSRRKLLNLDLLYSHAHLIIYGLVTLIYELLMKPTYQDPLCVSSTQEIHINMGESFQD